MDCIFCRIAAGEIPCSKVYETDEVLAFRDLNPQAPIHVLIIPKRHIASLQALTAADDELLGKLFLAAREIAKQLGVDETGYRIVSNVGEAAGQSVKHLHLHFISGKTLKWDN
ncbi:MAG TPA: histidine triad nucleotide-binding protein [Eubacteriales bacterium]|jgi:histidine triad (HIT) family protein|nr:histidine triad nucleotide-binding protein [Clostridia bacterium]HRV73635.1 histidine triad nucleotide-binding protein [Eubacteriales bacterium]